MCNPHGKGTGGQVDCCLATIKQQYALQLYRIRSTSKCSGPTKSLSLVTFIIVIVSDYCIKEQDQKGLQNSSELRYVALKRSPIQGVT